MFNFVGVTMTFYMRKYSSLAAQACTKLGVDKYANALQIPGDYKASYTIDNNNNCKSQQINIIFISHEYKDISRNV